EVADTFPNARIVVPGYFPLISESTPPHILWETVREWVFGSQETEAQSVEAFEDDWAQEPGASQSPGGLKMAGTLRRLAERSKEFVQASNDALEDAVKYLNAKRPPLPALRPVPQPPEASARAMFVPIPFGDDNAYGAPNSFLWRLGRKNPALTLKCADDNFITRFVVNDEMQAERPCMCDQAGRKNDVVCFRAGAFHPNRKGADAYFNAIRERLEKIIGFTGWALKE
ncbi:MAG: hypothetical protein JO360_02005, partial [Acidobacteria bacterium]|nr:hypothetical protein [Acidobacteriota bacterium]